MEISYYELSYDDIAAISRMEQEYFGQPWSESSIATYAEKGNTIFVVARSGQEVVGYIAILCILDEGNLVSIAVHDKCREMGIATFVMYGDADHPRALQASLFLLPIHFI